MSFIYGGERLNVFFSFEQYAKWPNTTYLVRYIHMCIGLIYICQEITFIDTTTVLCENIKLYVLWLAIEVMFIFYYYGQNYLILINH